MLYSDLYNCKCSKTSRTDMLYTGLYNYLHGWKDSGQAANDSSEGGGEVFICGSLSGI